MAIHVTNNQRKIYTSKEKSMGDLQDPIQWRYVNVPYVWPYFGGISPYIGLKNRPKIYGRYLQSIGS